jgi:hypothetical protein
MNYIVTFGNTYGRGDRITGQDIVTAKNKDQACTMANAMCARHESVLWIDEIQPMEDKDLLDYDSIDVI